MRLPDPPLLLITDRRQCRLSLPDVVAEALAAGCRWVSLREKDLEPDRRLSLLRELVEMGGRCGATIGVHGDPDAATSIPLGALHLPAKAAISTIRASLGRRLLLGISAHDAGEVEIAERDGADYATYGPVFESSSKPGYGPRPGSVPLSTVAARTGLPLIALGGVTPANVDRCIEAGASGVAVMGAVMSASRPGAVVADLVGALR